jgi:SAM-dependent methyltransferase
MTAIAPWLTQLLNDEIDDRVRTDPRTTNATFLGWPRERVFREVVGGGQADFDAPVGHLAGSDRALLYAKYNQRRHLDELQHAFDRLLTNARISFPTVLDLGCGPFTAGLSLASVLGNTEPFRYFGIDRAVSMLALGKRLADAARARGALHDSTTYWFGDNLGTVEFGAARGEITIVVASYLLASPSLEVEAIVKSVIKALKRIGPGPAAVLYTNSATPAASSKYIPFREALTRNGFKLNVEEVEVFADTDKKPTSVHYALLFRPASTEIDVTGSKR